jgi:hypothetical protein
MPSLPKELGYTFKLISLKIPQFAIIDKNLDLDAEFEFDPALTFSAVPEEKVLFIQIDFLLKQGDKIGYKLGVEAGFQFDEATFSTFKSGSQLVIPHQIAAHLITIVVGASRGAIVAKTESTRFHEIILPTINVVELIEYGDVELTPSPKATTP